MDIVVVVVAVVVAVAAAKAPVHAILKKAVDMFAPAPVKADQIFVAITINI